MVIKYSNRPFNDCEHMHRVLINNYNSTVGKHDICYFLGDIGLVNGEVIKEVISKLNGTKILIQGNHDAKGRQFWMTAGFVTVLHSASIRVARETVTMSHCPLQGLYREDTSQMRNGGENWHGEAKHIRNGFSLPDFGQFHLHGHIHSPNGGKSKRILGKQFDVGVDANKYRPVSISEIESWVAKTKKGDRVV